MTNKVSAQTEFLKAAYALLVADTDLTTLVGTRKTANRDEDIEVPYLWHGIVSIEDDDADLHDSDIFTYQVSIFDDSEEPASLMDAYRAIRELLHDNTTMVLTDHRVVNCRILASDVIDEPDGQDQQLVTQFRVKTEEL